MLSREQSFANPAGRRVEKDNQSFVSKLPFIPEVDGLNIDPSHI